MKKIENIRINYDLDNLDLDKLNPHPMIQFDIWFSQLSQNGDFNAVTYQPTIRLMELEAELFY